MFTVAYIRLVSERAPLASIQIFGVFSVDILVVCSKTLFDKGLEVCNCIFYLLGALSWNKLLNVFGWEIGTNPRSSLYNKEPYFNLVYWNVKCS